MEMNLMNKYYHKSDQDHDDMKGEPAHVNNMNMVLCCSCVFLSIVICILYCTDNLIDGTCNYPTGHISVPCPH